MDYDVPLDLRLDGDHDEGLIYNESGFDRERIY